MEVESGGLVEVNGLPPVVDGLVGEVVLLGQYLRVVLDVPQRQVQLQGVRVPSLLVDHACGGSRLVALGVLRLEDSLSILSRGRPVHRLEALVA